MRLLCLATCGVLACAFMITKHVEAAAAFWAACFVIISQNRTE
jgi:hypothetical protein